MLEAMSASDVDAPTVNFRMVEQQSNQSRLSHFVIVSTGTAGDIYPFVALALALEQRGHCVSVLFPMAYEAVAKQAGLRFHPIGSREDYFAALNDPDLWDARKGFAVVWRSIRDGLQRIPEFIAALPTDQRCVLLVHPLALPAAALARASRSDLRIVAVYLAPANLRTCHDPLTIGPLRIPRWIPLRLRRWVWRRIDAQIVDPVSLPDLNSARLVKGLAPVTHLVDHMHSVADHSVTLFPAWFAKPQPDWPRPLHDGEFPLYDPHPKTVLSDALARFLSFGEAPIVFTPGTGHRHSCAYFAQALLVVTRLNRRAIFLSRYREQCPEVLPRHVLWQDETPLHALLPRVSVLVHHGGIGTLAEALRAGVPQLVVPFAHDQFDNAARIEALGVGITLPGRKLNAGSLHRSLAALLMSSRIRDQCRAVALRFSLTRDNNALYEVLESA